MTPSAIIKAPNHGITLENFCGEIAITKYQILISVNDPKPYAANNPASGHKLSVSYLMTGKISMELLSMVTMVLPDSAPPLMWQAKPLRMQIERYFERQSMRCRFFSQLFRFGNQSCKRDSQCFGNRAGSIQTRIA